jgi:hypothetical protein
MLPLSARQSLPSKQYTPLIAIGNRKSEIASVAVPVIRRIERSFPNTKTAFLQESPNDIRSIQLAVFEVVD